MPNNISQKGETQTASFVVAKHIKAKHSFCPFHLFFFESTMAKGNYNNQPKWYCCESRAIVDHVIEEKVSGDTGT